MPEAILRELVTEVEPSGRATGLRRLVRHKPSIIAVPEDHPEKYKISGFAFSRRFKKAAGITSQKVPETDRDWQQLLAKKTLIRRIESDSDGGPVVNDNWIKIVIDGAHRNAGSSADYLWMRFGSEHKLKLWGIDHTRFPKGWWIQWDLNECSDFLETVRADSWDEIHLENPGGDGMLLRRITIVHSGTTIVDWRCNEWLDGSRGEKYGRLGLAAQILQHKLSKVDKTWVPQIHWAARELGKTDWRKYGNDEPFCSEFAAWCLGKALWDVPEAAEKADGRWGSRQMENWFEARDRKFDAADVTAKRYTLTAGDYLRVFDGTHSALFVRYLDGDANTGPRTPTLNTRIQTIEGNTSATVRVRERTISSITSIGSAR